MQAHKNDLIRDIDFLPRNFSRSDFKTEGSVSTLIFGATLA